MPFCALLLLVGDVVIIQSSFHCTAGFFRASVGNLPVKQSNFTPRPVKTASSSILAHKSCSRPALLPSFASVDVCVGAKHMRARWRRPPFYTWCRLCVFLAGVILRVEVELRRSRGDSSERVQRDFCVGVIAAPQHAVDICS